MARGEEWNTEAHVGKAEFSENMRVYSNSYLRSAAAEAVVGRISNLPEVESARYIAEGPNASFEIIVKNPEAWDFVEDVCYLTIQAELEVQHVSYD